MSWFNDDLDRIDAAVFSSDALESFDNRRELKAMCERWLRAVAERETLCKHGAGSDCTLCLEEDTQHDEAMSLAHSAMPTQRG